MALHDRYVVISCTRWWAAGGSMGDSMPLITAKSGRGMLASWGRMTFSLFCLTSLQGFCSSFTLIDLKASISHSYPQTEVISMCTEHYWMIRYMNMSYSEHLYFRFYENMYELDAILFILYVLCILCIL